MLSFKPIPKSVLIIIAIALVVVVMGVWRSFGPLQVETADARKGQAVEAVYATGVVEPFDISRIGAAAAGRIATVLVDIGAKVSKGQVLARLDDKTARERLEDARARLQLAQNELNRQEELNRRGFATAQALQKARTELNQATANVEINEKSLSDMDIRAPFDGYVMDRNIDPGQSIAASDVLFTIASTDRLRLVADVDERDIPRVQVGAEVLARAEAFPGEVFSARVSTINLLGDTRTRTYRVEAPLPDDTRLMAGMTVDVNVVLNKRDDAVLVPAAAVVRDNPQGSVPGKAYVWRIENGHARKIEVQVGAESPSDAEIRNGVAAGDRVIVNAPRDLKQGRRVI